MIVYLKNCLSHILITKTIYFLKSTMKNWFLPTSYETILRGFCILLVDFHSHLIDMDLETLHHTLQRFSPPSNPLFYDDFCPEKLNPKALTRFFTDCENTSIILNNTKKPMYGAGEVLNYRVNMYFWTNHNWIFANSCILWKVIWKNSGKFKLAVIDMKIFKKQ